MQAWEAIQTSIDYIEEHLKEDIKIEELAHVAALSPFYYQRLFSRLVGKPVNEYTKLRRLANAATALKNKDCRIMDIALDYRFSSHANFSRAFKGTFGITPDEYRTTPTRLNNFVKPNLMLNYVVIDEGVPLIVDDIVLEIRRKTLNTPETYLGLAAQVPISQQIPVGESTGVDIPGKLWDDFHNQKSEIANLIESDIELGASFMSKGEVGEFTYFAGSLTNFPNVNTEKFIKWELPANEYVVCYLEAPTFEELVTSCLNKAHKYLFETWLKNHKLVTQPFSAEKYFRNSSEVNCMEIWVVPIPNSSV